MSLKRGIAKGQFQTLFVCLFALLRNRMVACRYAAAI